MRPILVFKQQQFVFPVLRNSDDSVTISLDDGTIKANNVLKRLHLTIFKYYIYVKIRNVILLTTMFPFLVSCSENDDSQILNGTKWTRYIMSNSVLVIDFKSEKNFKCYRTDKLGNIQAANSFNGTYTQGCFSLVTFYCNSYVYDPPVRGSIIENVLYVEYKSGLQYPFSKK